MHARRWSTKWAVVGLLFGCLDSTQVTFKIGTDVPCDRANGTAITVGLEGQTEKAEPIKVVTNCDADGKVAAIGTYAVTPGKKAPKVASARITLAVGQDIDVKTACTPSNGYQGCVVARRKVSFVTHRSLVVPVDLYLNCKDVQCDENSTCNRAGKCVSSTVNPDACDAEGVCAELVTVAGEGLPCFNTPGSPTLVCTGDSSWCNVSTSGTRTCSSAPSDSGVSLQCRNSSDCGPGLFCVVPGGSILGQCSPHRTPDDQVLCRFGEMISPCADAGMGLTTCRPPSDGGLAHDGGLACPRTPNFYCVEPTPNCELITGTPQCVADGGAQCWYPSDCPLGTGCFAGPEARLFNVCQAGYTQRNPIALCNETMQGADCPPGMTCTGNFYGLRACADRFGQIVHWGPQLPCPPVGDAGLICDGLTPVCTQNAMGEYACVAPPTRLPDGGTDAGPDRQWRCRSNADCLSSERCVYHRDSNVVTTCEPTAPDGGQAIVCDTVADCPSDSACGLAKNADGLSLCSQGGPSCGSNDFWSTTRCGSGQVCCLGLSGRSCTTQAQCISGADAGDRPVSCNSATQCAANEWCIRANPSSFAPNAGVVCTALPPTSTLEVRDIHCQPETEARDCQLRGRTRCVPAFNGNYHCVLPDDGGYPAFYAYPDGGIFQP